MDGESFAGELHLVHWDKSKYGSFTEAAGQPDGLAVLGVFLKVGKHHPEMDKIAQLLPFITHKGDRITLREAIDPAKLLPEDTTYWTYLGSLTTPPFYESVIWIVFKHAIEVSEEQVSVDFYENDKPNLNLRIFSTRSWPSSDNSNATTSMRKVRMMPLAVMSSITSDHHFLWAIVNYVKVGDTNRAPIK